MLGRMGPTRSGDSGREGEGEGPREVHESCILSRADDSGLPKQRCNNDELVVYMCAAPSRMPRWRLAKRKGALAR